MSQNRDLEYSPNVLCGKLLRSKITNTRLSRLKLLIIKFIVYNCLIHKKKVVFRILYILQNYNYGGEFFLYSFT